MRALFLSPHFPPLGLFVALVLASVGIAQEPTPQPGHGPYANRDGWHCYRGPQQDDKKLAHCGCKLQCDDQGNPREANDCMTFCDNSHKQCLCHTDEGCH